METFTLVITAIKKNLYSGKATYCGLATLSGAMGMEARHESMMGVLLPHSTIEYKDGNGKTSTVSVESGIFSFIDNVCTITVQIAE